MAGVKLPLWTITQLNNVVKDTLDSNLMPVRVSGEISGMTLHRSGHVYMTLKDETSQIRAVYFNGVEKCLAFQLKNGDLVEADGSIDFYTRRGECQLNVTSLRPNGVGLLQIKFEEMKRRLAAEGLFDSARKKPLPFIPRCIGIVTSPEGAAIKDFIKVALQRFPPLRFRLFPSPVQGKGAEDTIAQGIDFFNNPAVKGIDVILVTRGGGSMEDLWPFNEEVVARAIARSRKPVVSAVGHEIDTTICDLAADLRVPTPTAAAEAILPDLEAIYEGILIQKKHLSDALELRVQREELRLSNALRSRALSRPAQLIQERSQTIDMLMRDMNDYLSRASDQAQNRLERAKLTLEKLNPSYLLQRGYSVILDNSGKALLSPLQAPEGTELTALLAEGKLKLISKGKI